MNFDLVRPCSHCPFRTDCLKGWLGKWRAKELADAIVLQQQTFSCHETSGGREDDGVRGPDEQHCAGAAILLERLERPNQIMRIFERFGLYDRTKLDMDSPVFPSVAAFVKHHTEKRKR